MNRERSHLGLFTGGANSRMVPESDGEPMVNQTCPEGFRLNPGVTRSIHDGGLVILHVPSGRMFTSNQAGARIWQCLEQRLPLEAIAAEISRHYGVDRGKAREDVACFLADLDRNGLAERGTELCSK